jgi:hypothetical protein
VDKGPEPGASGPDTSSRRERWEACGAAAVFLAFALNFGAYRVFGDGVDYYSFVQRLFGDRSTGSGYNFGTGLMNAPFYGAAKVAQAVVGARANRLLPSSITIASIACLLIAIALSAWLVRQMRLPHPWFAAVLAVFGSPLWYYATFSPSYTHAADGAAFSLAAAALWQVFAHEDLHWRVATGAALGLEVTVRPFNLALLVGALIALLAWRRVRDALLVGFGAVTVTALLLLVPLLLGTSLRRRADGELIAGNHLSFSPLSPLRMLFSEHRGLFIWTPATLLATVGIVLLLRARGRFRPFVVALTAMVVCLLLSYAFFAVWDGGWSFSARYLAAPLPFYALGLARLFATRPRRVRIGLAALVAATVMWSVFLGMSHAFGAGQNDGAFQVARRHANASFFSLAWSYSRVRHVFRAIG